MVFIVMVLQKSVYDVLGTLCITMCPVHTMCAPRMSACATSSFQELPLVLIFLDRDDVVDVQAFEFLGDAAGPAYLQRVDLRAAA